MPRKKYRSYSIPDDLAAKIDKVVEKGRYGYASATELIREAIRLRLEDLERRR